MLAVPAMPDVVVEYDDATGGDRRYVLIAKVALRRHSFGQCLQHMSARQYACRAHVALDVLRVIHRQYEVLRGRVGETCPPSIRKSFKLSW